MAATLTLGAGIPLGVLGWGVVEIAGLYQLQFLYACGVMTLISCLIFVGASLVSVKPSRHQVAALTWSREFWRSESRQLAQSAWYQDYRVQSAGLLAIALLIVVYWW